MSNTWKFILKNHIHWVNWDQAYYFGKQKTSPSGIIFTNHLNFDVAEGEIDIQYHLVPGIYIFTSISGYMETSVSSDELDFMVKEVEKGVFACTECGKSSKCKRDLKRHIASKHTEGEPVR